MVQKQTRKHAKDNTPFPQTIPMWQHVWAHRYSVYKKIYVGVSRVWLNTSKALLWHTHDQRSKNVYESQLTFKACT